MRFYHQMLVPIGTGITEEDRVFLQNSFMDEGVPLHILKPRDGKVVSCLFGNLFVNQYTEGLVEEFRGS